MNQFWFSTVSLWKLSTFQGYKGIYSRVWDGMWKVTFQQNRVHQRVTRDWDESRVLVTSYQTRPYYTFFSCSDPVGLTLQLLACFTRVLHFGKSPLVSQLRVQLRVTFLLHTVDQIFILSHTQLLHYSHLNTAFLNVKL